MINKESDYSHIEQTYDEGSEDYSVYHWNPHSYIEPERQHFIDRMPAGATILDCGCGPGMDTERFTQLGYRVTAIDLSDRFIRMTKQRVPGAVVRKMDMRHLDFPEATFDGIWTSFSLIHIRANDLTRALAGFKTVLREGGVFFAAVHRGSKTSWIRTRITAMQRDTYLQEWLQTDIERVIIAAGFKLITSRPFEREGGEYPLLSILAHL